MIKWCHSCTGYLSYGCGILEYSETGGYLWFNNQYSDITIPSTVEGIGEKVFQIVNGIENVYSNALTPPTISTEYNFNKVNSTTAKLYVPKGTYTAYLLSNWGSVFTNIIEMD